MQAEELAVQAAVVRVFDERARTPLEDAFKSIQPKKQSAGAGTWSAGGGGAAGGVRGSLSLSA